jgi:hypothetical protein
VTLRKKRKNPHPYAGRHESQSAKVRRGYVAAGLQPGVPAEVEAPDFKSGEAGLSGPREKAQRKKGLQPWLLVPLKPRGYITAAA